MTVALEMREIVKDFPGVRALDRVNFTIEPGQILGLCGENGAGKSTLMKILSGVIPHPEYEGRILIDGAEKRFHTTKEAEQSGIAIIHQELSLFPQLTVAENLFMGNEVARRGVIDWDETRSSAVRLLERFRINIDPDDLVSDLNIGENQLVEIARALSKNARFLILDEPTSALTGEEVVKLFSILRDLRQSGVACVYISHKLDEVKELCDAIAVLRDGRTIGEPMPTATLNKADIVRAMVGRDIAHLYPRVEHAPGETILEIKNFSVDHPFLPGERIIEDAAMHVREGEILGIYGLMGSGRSELLTAIFGGFAPDEFSGEVFIRGNRVKIQSPCDAIRAGIGLCTEDRKILGLFLEAGLDFNISIAALGRFFAGRGVVDRHRELETVRESIRTLGVKTPSEFQTVKNLSGGNQQKGLLGRWLLSRPSILFLDEPTRGVDVGAKSEIYQIMNRLKMENKGIVMVSSDLPELLGMSDRVMVMREGRLVAECAIGDATPEKLGALATGNV